MKLAAPKKDADTHTLVLDMTQRNAQADYLMRMLREVINGVEKYGARQGSCITISYFENCRERGYTIERRFNIQESEEPVGIGTGSKTRTVNFAENRNSDDIVVYPFAWDNKAMKDTNYRQKSKYFQVYHFQDAFEFIVKHLELGDL